MSRDGTMADREEIQQGVELPRLRKSMGDTEESNCLRQTRMPVMPGRTGLREATAVPAVKGSINDSVVPIASFQRESDVEARA